MPPSVTPPAAPPADAELYCPSCGYDLRATHTGICPECGEAFDREALVQSGIPWEHRERIGRWRAFWRTTWISSFRLHRFRSEAARDVNYASARKFQIIAAAISFTSLSVPLAILRANIPMSGFGGMSTAVWMTGGWFGTLPWTLWNDVSLCIGTGLLLWPVPFLSLFLFLLGITGVGSYLCHPRSQPVVRQNRAIAISYYASAPLLWTPVGILLVLCGAGVLASDLEASPLFRGIAVSLLITGAIIAVPLPQMLVKNLRLLRWSTQAGAARLWLAGLLLIVGWIAIGLLTFGLLPAMIGFAKLLIDAVMG